MARRSSPGSSTPDHQPGGLVLVHTNNRTATPSARRAAAYYTRTGPDELPAAVPRARHRRRRAARCGEVRLRPDNPDPTKFPPYYDEAIFFGEFTRDMLREIRLDSENRVFKINNCSTAARRPRRRRRRAPFECDNPMDMQFDEDGHFYLLTYGDGFFNINPDAGMYKVGLRQGPAGPDRGAVGHADQRHRR